MSRPEPPSPLVLIDADATRRGRLERLAAQLGAPCRAASAPAQLPPGGAARVAVQVGPADAAALAELRRHVPGARLIVAGLDRGQAVAVAALRAGAEDFVCLEGGDGELAERIAHHLGEGAPEAPDAEGEACGLVGDSPAIAELRRFTRRVARSEATALISGETGAGKECVALLLHRASPRAGGPLVAVNCAAIPEALLESELFGHARGAFSGAVRDHPGKMALAHGGTLFLDEVGELSPAGQAKLLRAVETREVHPVGGRGPRAIDVRIIAATNRDLAAETAAGRFREDLYWRLAVARIRTPPLRERREDIAALARHLLAGGTGAGGGAAPPRLHPAAVARLAAHDWPGNARELRNALEVACIEAEGGEILPRHLGLHEIARASGGGTGADAGGSGRGADGGGSGRNGSGGRTQAEHAALVAALRRCGDNKAAAARELNCSRMTLYRRMARHGLTDQSRAEA